MKREFNVEANVGRPWWPIAKRSEKRSKARRQVRPPVRRPRPIRPCGTLGRPANPAAGFQFESKIVGGVVPREYWNAVEKGAREALESGVISGYPMVDVHVTLLDGSYHEVDSSEMAFHTAASMA
jgi:elongation factor G